MLYIASKFTVGLLTAFLVCPPPRSCLSLVAGLFRLVFSVLRLFRLVFLACLSDGLGFDSCSLCDFTACIGMSLPSACSFQLVFGLVISRRLYTSVCFFLLSAVYLWWKHMFFTAQPWRVTTSAWSDVDGLQDQHLILWGKYLGGRKWIQIPRPGGAPALVKKSSLLYRKLGSLPFDLLKKEARFLLGLRITMAINRWRVMGSSKC